MKKRSFYVPTTPDMFYDHVRVSGLKVSDSKAARLLSLYTLLLGEQNEFSWPKSRAKIQGAIEYYKDHSDTVLDADLKMLVKLGVVQVTPGRLRFDTLQAMGVRPFPSISAADGQSSTTEQASMDIMDLF